MDEIVSAIKASASAWAGNAIPAAYAAGLKLAAEQAAAAGIDGSPLSGSFALINRGAVQLLALEVANDLGKAAQSMAATASKVLRQTAQMQLDEAQIDKILAGGLITGQPLQAIRALRAELEKVHGSQVTVPTKKGGSMTFDVGYYAEIVARTKTREAVVTATNDRLAELGQDLVTIVGRVSNNFCTAYLGNVFSLSGRSTDYPPLESLPSGGPPFHPNCSKSTALYVEDLASESQQQIADDGVDPALLNVSPTQAQRSFKDLQVRSQKQASYVTTSP